MVLAREVAKWYLRLRPTDRAIVDEAIGLLKQQGNQLGMPWSRPLGRGLLELRFNLANKAQRITYTFDPDRRIITLTTFTKQRDNESVEIRCARRVLAKLRQRRSQ